MGSGEVATPCPERWHRRPLQAASNSFSTITSGAVSTAFEPWEKGITWTSLWVSSQRGHGFEASPAPSAPQDGTPHPGMFVHRAQPGVPLPVQVAGLKPVVFPNSAWTIGANPGPLALHTATN